MRQGFLFLVLLSGFLAKSQVGGQFTYSSLNVAENARISANGGENVSFYGDDVNLLSYNPAAINDSMGGVFSVNFLPFYADVNKSSFVGAANVGKTGTWGFGLHYTSYGEFVERDIAGNELGTFQGSDYNISITKGHSVGPFALGATLKFAGSQLSDYNSFATMLDLGGLWKHQTRDFTIGMVVKNLGVILKDFTPTTTGTLPLNVQLGSSYKLEHMPLRFSTTVHRLNIWDIQYLDPVRTATTDENGDEVLGEKKVSEQIARHFVFSGEFILGPKFHVRVGYNHLRRKELKVDARAASVGFSMGVMLKVKQFTFDYARSKYHLFGTSNVLTLSADMNKMMRKKARKPKEELSDEWL